MKNILFILAILIYQNAQAQLVVDVADFAANPSKYNGRTIVLRSVNITKTTGATMSLSGPRTTSSQTPTSGINPSGGAITGWESLKGENHVSRKQKTINYLISKGYYFEDIASMLKRITND